MARDICSGYMGPPVKIDILARNLIRLSGLQTVAIQIFYTGRCAGEKLYEEKTGAGRRNENNA